MTDHLATGMKRMIRTVARSASLSDRLGEQSRLLRLTGNRSTLDFRPAEHGADEGDDDGLGVHGVLPFPVFGVHIATM